MIEKLHYILNSKICSYQLRLPMLILLIMGPASNLLVAQETTGTVFGPSEMSLSYDFNACRSFSGDNSAFEYSEFTSVEANSCTGVSSGHLYRYAGKHSCTDDAHGNPGDAVCFQSSTDNTYDADNELAIRFDVTLESNGNRGSRLDGISFQQLAPENYLWSAAGHQSATGRNNYPTKFGIRVLKDDTEIYIEDNIATTQSWKIIKFDFSENIEFQVAAGESDNFTFELISYAPVGNGAAVSAWDLDNLKIFTACELECNLSVDTGADQISCKDEAVTLTALVDGAADCPKVISSYKIEDSTTEVGCFTSDPGVIFQKYDDCNGIEYTWRAGEDLVLEEYDNNTATITGSIIDQNGRVATVQINLGDKEHSGTTWDASCYLDGISGPETYYRSFTGIITADGIATTVGTRFNSHYILANGAGFDSNQYGLGAWTGGDFGSCTEWFGNLVPLTIDTTTDDLTYLWSTGETTPSITVTESGEYTVIVEDCKGCKAADTVQVTIENTTAHASDDETICAGDYTTLTVSGEGTYLWSTGETTQSIDVSPETTTTYYITVKNGECEATDEVIVTVEDKIIIGDYVWLDENRNGLQDENDTGINGISVKLYQCETNNLIDSTESINGANGAGYYQFDVCPDTGAYYIVFGDIPDELQFTMINAGDILKDSNANEKGKTECFVIEREENLTIDAGLNEICDLNVDAGEAKEICINTDATVDLTATIENGNEECPGGCVYPILEQERCFGPTGTFEIWLNSRGGLSSWAFKASEQRFERLANGDARYSATASNGVDTIEMDVTFSGYTTIPTLGSPKLNDCQDYDTSDWEYWTTWTGTIISENHGVYTMSMMGAPFQMGVGADVTRSGFGASGWFTTEGGDGYYTIGDVNIPLAECQENGVEYKWTTEDGNIVTDPYKKTISVDKPGTYIFEAINCVDCFTTDKVVVSPINCGKSILDKTTKISTFYPIPVASGGTLTIKFGEESADTTSPKAIGIELKEDVSLMVYDMNGRMISVPRTFKMVNGKATIYLDVDHIPSGKYIVRAQGNQWAESKHILVR